MSHKLIGGFTGGASAGVGIGTGAGAGVGTISSSATRGTSSLTTKEPLNPLTSTEQVPAISLVTLKVTF